MDKDFRLQKQRERIAELEGKLSVTVEALERIANILGDHATRHENWKKAWPIAVSALYQERGE
jgi:hypothetical protein